MESGFLTLILLSSFVVRSSHLHITDMDNVVVAREGSPTTLLCTDTTVRGAVSINWLVQSLGEEEWKLVLSANEKKEFTRGAPKASMRLTDANFQETGVFSLFFNPTRKDSGLYSCLIKQQEKKIKERNIFLAILTVAVHPSSGAVPQQSTLRLIANVRPDFAVTKITWAASDGNLIKSETSAHLGTEAKLPQANSHDSGVYICTVYPWGNSSLFAFRVNVTIDAERYATFTDKVYDHKISTTVQAQQSLTLNCPSIQGDVVFLYHTPTDSKTRNNNGFLRMHDRWRGSSMIGDKGERFRLAGPPYSAEAGSFAFLHNAELKDGGLYMCDVILNQERHSLRTELTVMKVYARLSSSMLKLDCQYSGLSQVKSVRWEHQDKNRKLGMSSTGLGSIVTTVSFPITPDTAGNYTCVLTLKNGQTTRQTHTVKPPTTGNVRVNTPSMLLSLSTLLLLVPLVTAAVGVLLWKQKHISNRGIEQSLSVHSGEVENIYASPEDIRQAPPQGSVYMDLKPRGEDDVYKELDRYEQCQR